MCVLNSPTPQTLLSYPQVLVTPHSAFLTHEALHNIATTTCQNIADFALGRALLNEVKLAPSSPLAPAEAVPSSALVSSAVVGSDPRL